MTDTEHRPGTFTKGDPRINRKGKPRSFDALRKLAQQIAHEEAQSRGKTLIVNGRIATVAEAIMRQWAASNNPVLQKAFVEIAFGKVPDKTELTGKDGGEIILRVIYDTKTNA